MSVLQLDTLTHLQPDGCHSLEFVLTNLGPAALSGFTLGFDSQPQAQIQVQGQTARLLRMRAQHYEYAPPGDLCLPPGDSWHLPEADICSQVALSEDIGWTVTLIPQQGPAQALLASDPQVAGQARMGRGGGDAVGILPEPALSRISAFAAHSPQHLLIRDGTTDARAQAVHVNALSHRLFPARPTPFVFAAVPGTPALRLQRDANIADQAYRLLFTGGDVVLSYADNAGLRHGLVTLAQLLGAAWQQPARFAMPADGVIEDQPGHDWRGVHLKMPRRVHGPCLVQRIVDLMAWQKLNRLHWQLTDGEDWLIEIGCPKPLPRLRPVDPDHVIRYSRAEAIDIVAHAQSLGIEIMPEIDLPGFHAQALGGQPAMIAGRRLTAGPSLVRGYPDTALDGAQDAAWDLTVRILGDICDIFPFKVIHIGGATTDEDIWLNSPRAQALQGGRQLAGTADLRADYLRGAHSLLRAYYLRRVHALLESRGRVMGAWTELAQGRAIPTQGSRLFARDAEAAEWVARGYAVIGRPDADTGASAASELSGVEVPLRCPPSIPGAEAQQSLGLAMSSLAQTGWGRNGTNDPLSYLLMPDLSSWD